MATGVAYSNHTLYVVDIDKVYAWDQSRGSTSTIWGPAS